ncbi:sulfite exporter TauE/SafE family protein [Paenibacillus humicola]|uniref:sulfite exporter TauE/SafE family protein n=1 Tax=Paenibacillus humicola TaxID=3110540 RepID=UPI00237A4768|nr:TSUP family transporter [Paenibacillus humicola]
MEGLTLDLILLVALGGFAAAFVDAVVGGGGLISVPVLLMAGLPPHLALGTNKLAGTMSSLTSTLSFLKSGHVELKLAGRLLPLTLLGAGAGTYALQHIPSGFLKPLVIVLLLAVTVYTLLRKSWGNVRTYRALTRRSGLWMAAAALLLGGYDGFFGPGTGSFLLFAFLLLGFDFVSAAGNAKVLNFGSNAASLAVFLLLGGVDYRLGLIMGAAMVLGSLIGSQVAIRKGARYVRPLFVAMTLLLVGKQLWDLIV